MASSKKPPKIKLATAIRLRPYTVVERAVEEGLSLGWHRAHKHTDKPDKETMVEKMRDAVMSELCEAIDMDGDANG